ncbi:acyltransferase family protein [Neptunitalea lumnitzerae]|uniref:O-acetyltransferase n=1 Tax=Neptunitalea lumnitzerae TaxID=2965509 RepID=A0ABQ5MH30_9FLAO|nr:acyltransferase family protein [Neptunitalea sp. Y10]GLB48667.1 O-acetyltransferase [Neptunitalea sp. Y10]
MSATNRIHHIDVLKGIAIFLVVFGHTIRQTESLVFIYSFHMPLFFIISGLFFNEKKFQNFGDVIIKKARTLLLPYVTFYVLGYLYWFFVEKNVRPGLDLPFYNPLVAFLYGSDIGEFKSVNGILWFLPALFAAESILYLLLQLNKRILIIIGLIFSLVVAAVLSYIKTLHLPFCLGASFVAVFFMGVGYYGKGLLTLDLAIKKRIIYFIISMVLFVVTFKVAQYNPGINVKYAGLQNPLLFVVTSFTGSIATMLLAFAVFKMPLLEYFGRNTLYFIGFSEPIKRVVIYLSAKISPLSVEELRSSVPFSLGMVIVCFILMVPVIFIFNKYLFFAVGKRKKKIAV